MKHIEELVNTAMLLVAGDKGLLVMDESNSTCNKWLAALDIPQTAEYFHMANQIT